MLEEGGQKARWVVKTEAFKVDNRKHQRRSPDRVWFVVCYKYITPDPKYTRLRSFAIPRGMNIGPQYEKAPQKQQ